MKISNSTQYPNGYQRIVSVGSNTTHTFYEIIQYFKLDDDWTFVGNSDTNLEKLQKQVKINNSKIKI